MAETCGWLMDKIIVSELKIYHMRKQVERKDASSDHKTLCRKRLRVLQEQRNDLKDELSGHFQGVLLGKVRPKIYRQFKMYNDPRYGVKA